MQSNPIFFARLYRDFLVSLLGIVLATPPEIMFGNVGLVLPSDSDWRAYPPCTESC